MKLIKKIYPSHTTDSPLNRKLNILFISEGYTASDKRQFEEDCDTQIKNLFKIYPFSLLEFNFVNLNFFNVFTTSDNYGPRIGSIQQNRTIFDSNLNNADNKIELDKLKIQAYIEDLYFLDNKSNTLTLVNGEICISESIWFLTCILIPKSNTYGIGESIYINTNLTTSYVNYLSYVCNDFSAQALANYIGLSYGLSQEFDMDGITYDAPTSLVNEKYTNNSVNIISSFEINTLNYNKWDRLSTKRQSSKGITQVLNTRTISNRDLLNPFLTTNKIEYWEGGDGYRNDVFRSWEDCIMRRKIASVDLPLNTQKLEFCPVCSAYLKQLF